MRGQIDLTPYFKKKESAYCFDENTFNRPHYFDDRLMSIK